MPRPPLLLVVALAGALPYLGILDAPFLDLDDAYFITELRLWREPGPAAVWDVLSAPVFGAWHPLHQLSYLVDRLVWGATAFGVRLDQALLHGGCAAAVVALARRLGLAPVAAAVAGLLFAWHPAHAENVGWPSQRKDLLSCLFLLLALRAWHAPPGPGGAPPARARAASLLLLTLSLLSKSSGSVLAPMFLISSVAGASDRRDVGPRLRRDAPWLAATFALAAGATAIHFVAQRDIGAVRGDAHAPATHARQILRAVDYYAVTAVVPLELSMVIADPAGSPLGALDARAVAVAAGLAAAIVVSWRRRRRTALLLLWALVALGPMIGLVPLPTFVQNRYLLVSTAALALLVGDLLAAAGRRSPALRHRLLLLAGALLVGLAWLSARAAAPWTDIGSVWRHALEVDPRSATAAARLAESTTTRARARSDRAEMAEAVRLARAAVALSPNQPMARAALGEALMELGSNAEARVQLEAVAASSWNGAYQAALQLALLDLDEGDHAAARVHLARVRQLNPRSVEADSVEAQLALAEGRPADAAAALRRVLELMPVWDEAWGRLADALRLDGDRAGAVEALARSAGPLSPAVRAHLALDEGRVDAAAELLADPALSGSTLTGEVAALRLALARGDRAGAERRLADGLRRRGPLLRARARLEPDLRELVR